MRIRGKRVVSVVLSVVLPACASAPPRPPLSGRTVELQPAGGEKVEAVKGELLAVGPDQLWILGPDGVRRVPSRDVAQARVVLHGLDGRKAGLWALLGGLITGAVLTGACASVEGNSNCGSVFAVTAAAWGLIGAPAALALGKSSRLRVPGSDLEALRPYARFPQGLPEGMPGGIPEQPPKE